MPDDLDSPLLVRVGGLQAVKGGQAAEEGGAAAGNDACENKYIIHLTISRTVEMLQNVSKVN